MWRRRRLALVLLAANASFIGALGCGTGESAPPSATTSVATQDAVPQSQRGSATTLLRKQDAIPAPTAANQVEIRFGAEVEPEVREMVRDGAAMAAEYFRANLHIELPPVSMFVFRDAQAWVRHVAPEGSSDCAYALALLKAKAASFKAAKTDGRWNGRDASVYLAPRNGPLAQWEVNLVVVHELFHVAQWSARGSPATGGASTVNWLDEGAAELAAALVNDGYHLVALDISTSTRVNTARSSAATLAATESGGASVGGVDRYFLGYLALVLQGEPVEQLRRALETQRQMVAITDAALAFEAAFGVDLSVFRAAFEARRASGFPVGSGNLRGTVHNADGLPEQGVLLAACHPDGNGCTYTTPGAGGAFALDVAPGSSSVLQVSLLDAGATSLGFWSSAGLVRTVGEADQIDPAVETFVKLTLPIPRSNLIQTEPLGTDNCSFPVPPPGVFEKPGTFALGLDAPAGTTELIFTDSDMDGSQRAVRINPGGLNEETIGAPSLLYFRGYGRLGKLTLASPLQFDHKAGERIESVK